MSVLVEPSSSIVPGALLQLTDAKPLVFCCNVHPVEGEGQESATAFVVVRRMDKRGAPDGCAAVLNRYTAPAAFAPVLSKGAPTNTRSVPSVAREEPNRTKSAGTGSVKVVSNAPLVLNRYAAPVRPATVVS